MSKDCNVDVCHSTTEETDNFRHLQTENQAPFDRKDGRVNFFSNLCDIKGYIR